MDYTDAMRTLDIILRNHRVQKPVTYFHETNNEIITARIVANDLKDQTPNLLDKI
jgi:hypothetical protein